MILIVDASVVVKWFVQESLSDRARDLITSDLSRVVPDLVFPEVGNALWSKARREEITFDQARLSIESLDSFFDRIVPSQDIAIQALEIAEAIDHPVYDCFYLACAENVDDGRLITDDKRLLGKAEEAGLEHQVAALAEFLLDTKFELRIGQEKLGHVIRLSEFYQDLSKNLRETLKQENGWNILTPEDLKTILETPAFRNLVDYVEELERTEQVDLLVLGWLGQGYSGTEWQPLRDKANLALSSHDANYLQYVCSLTRYLERGLSVLEDH